jgi:hypothetical protein
VPIRIVGGEASPPGDSLESVIRGEKGKLPSLFATEAPLRLLRAGKLQGVQDS